MKIRPYRDADRDAVIALWRECGLTRPWNDPVRDIERKRAVQPGMFVVGVLADRLIASAMVGFDGHRGWVNYLAVSPPNRGLGFGRQLMRHAERMLIDCGCPKLNLQVRASNTDALAFYRRLGYAQDDVVCFGQRLIVDAAAENGESGV